MKLAITSKEEIKSLLDLCNEIEILYKELQYKELDDIEIESEFLPIMSECKKRSDSVEEFMTNIFRQFDQIHFQRILWNCSTLLENCADLSKDTLDFNTNIKAGFEALEVLKEIDDYLKPSPKNHMYSESILHQKIRAVLSNMAVDVEVSHSGS